MKTIVTFGEIMGRLTPDRFLRFAQSCPGRLDLTFAGSEANVAVSVRQFGGPARFVTALPHHAIADACVTELRGLDVDTQFILRTDQGRLGLYFVETGANQRPSQVIYDRDGSAVSLTSANSYRWDEIYADAGWLHITGITPALSRTAADAVLVAARRAKELGLTVSCDLNFRKKLWRWDAALDPRALARRTMSEILPLVDLVIANEEDASDVLGIRAADTDVASGRLAADRYPEVAAAIVAQFPNIVKVAITLRESISATHNNWGAMLYDARTGTARFAPTVEGAYRPYEIRAIVDRVGGGDAFAAGLIFALNCPEYRKDDQTVVAFAAAASCLAHSIQGDFNYSTRAEVEALIQGSGSGRVNR